MGDPAGTLAEPVATLTLVMTIGALLLLALVVGALALALFGPPRWRARIGSERTVIALGIALPIVVLTALLVWGLTLTAKLVWPQPDNPLRIRVTGKQWWWDVAYQSGAQPITANEIVIPTGRVAEIELHSTDVIHSFWVPRLAGKIDMIPGKSNRLYLQADEPGVYHGHCAEYCGGPHALMGFTVVAHPPAQFARLMEARIDRAGAPAAPVAGRGAELFQSAGCAACHRIAGTQANGLAGPDLTHVGSRRMLGAGILQNNRGTMMGWIGNSQAIKPSNRMPPYTILSAEELTALATYLEAQK